MRAWHFRVLVLSSLVVGFHALAGAVDVIRPPVPLPVVKALSVAMRPLQNPTGGQEVGLWVQLSAPAPCVYHCGQTVTGQTAGGMLVLLSSSNPAVAKVPASILVPVGKTVQAFTSITSPVAAPTPVVISAWREGSPPQTATVTVVPPSLTRIAVDQASVTSGTVVHGTAFFTGPPASAGTVVAKLSSNNSAAVQLQASVTLDVNKTVATFDIKTAGVGQDTPVAIYASYAGATKNANLTVLAAALKEIAPPYYNARYCLGPGTTVFEVRLTGIAPPEGAGIQLSSRRPELASVPASVTVPAQQDKVSIPIACPVGVNSDVSVDILASYKGVTKKDHVVVWPVTKPDLVITGVSLYDRFGNPITRPQDSQAFKMCITVKSTPDDNKPPDRKPPPSALRVSYLSPTGIGTSAGREYDINVDFSDPNSSGFFLKVTPCTELPGLQPGSYYDVTLTADFYNKVEERNEGNNTYKLRISR